MFLSWSCPTPWLNWHHSFNNLMQSLSFTRTGICVRSSSPSHLLLTSSYCCSSSWLYLLSWVRKCVILIYINSLRGKVHPPKWKFSYFPLTLRQMECLVVRKTFLKLQRFSISSVILQHSVGDVRSHIDLKRCFDTLFKAETFTAAAKLKEHATWNSVDAWARLRRWGFK